MVKTESVFHWIEYDDIHTRIVQIMDDLATQIKDAAVNKSYRKPPDNKNDLVYEEKTEMPIPVG